MLNSLQSKFQTWQSRRNIARLVADVARRAPVSARAPVAFFNASTRLTHLSLNAAFSLLTSWSLRLAGVPVVHFVCQRGMSRCVLGTDPDVPAAEPPCAQCIAQSRRLFAEANVDWFEYSERQELQEALARLDVAQLQAFEYADLPLGQLVLPTLRWALRRHNLKDDEGTRFLYQQYILSAHNVAEEFGAFLDRHQPQAIVLFNGIMYPEAVARRLARQRGIRTVTHEVGLRPFSAFFSEGEATAYPMDIPAEFTLSAKQNAQLDEYLSQRFQGRFSMAGIQFWKDMQELDEDFLKKAAGFKQIVPVFTNVIFDTSQVHANVLFDHMFAWLDKVLEIIKQHPDTLFIVRAHPDEMRPNSRKQSRESVAGWVRQNRVEDLSNVVFVDSGEYLSSYALIQRAHFVMVYNSSIGLEASIMGRPVLSGGASRYTSFPTVHFPANVEEFESQARAFLAAEKVEQPAPFVQEARRVLYYQLYKTGLSFADYLADHQRMGYVRMRSFSTESLLPGNSPTMETLYQGIVNGQPFLV